MTSMDDHGQERQVAVQADQRQALRPVPDPNMHHPGPHDELAVHQGEVVVVGRQRSRQR